MCLFVIEGGRGGQCWGAKTVAIDGVCVWREGLRRKGAASVSVH